MYSTAFTDLIFTQRQPLDLVAIWGLMANGSNSIARLAIHIYSIIANSGATERNFSDYGNIQTKKHSLLKIEKVHKTNVLHMDILHRHAELGYTESRGKRKLGGADSEGTNYVAEPAASDNDDNENDDDTEFGSLASRLINAATATAAVGNNTDNAEDPTLLSTALQPHRRCPTRTQIRLEDLFDYQNANNYLDFYHTAAKQNLQTEAETFEQMFAEQDGNETVIPTVITPLTCSSSIN
jgi:hypothetical protein